MTNQIFCRNIHFFNTFFGGSFFRFPILNPFKRAIKVIKIRQPVKYILSKSKITYSGFNYQDTGIHYEVNIFKVYIIYYTAVSNKKNELFIPLSHH